MGEIKKKTVANDLSVIDVHFWKGGMGTPHWGGSDILISQKEKGGKL